MIDQNAIYIGRSREISFYTCTWRMIHNGPPKHCVLTQNRLSPNAQSMLQFPHHEDIQGDQRYISTHSEPRHPVSGWLHAPTALPPAKNSGTHWKGCWIGPRTFLEVLKKSEVSEIKKPLVVQLSSSPFSATLLPNINPRASSLIQWRDCNPNQTLDNRRERFCFTWSTP